jgi:hypothetical protein
VTRSRGPVHESPARGPLVALFWVAAVVAILAIVIGAIFGVGALAKEYTRYQHRQDAANQIDIREEQILVAEREIEVERNRAKVRVEEAQGIRRSQEIINATLTPAYLQWRAIEAQLEIAQSGENHTQVYVPTGPNGVPLVFGAERTPGAVQASP